MCFHSKQSKSAQTLEHRFGAKVKSPALFQVQDSINGFTFPQTPVITNVDTEIIDHFHWGLIPAWATDESVRKFTLNAKIETIALKPSFRNSANKRCLILADGFYEWQWLDAKGRKKQKYLVGLPDGDPFAFGGIWSQWVDLVNGGVRNTYSIVTTEATGIMREIHNSKMRMPVILSPENERLWLAGEGFDAFKTGRVELSAMAIL